MYNDIIKDFKKVMNIKKDSKLSISCNEDLDLFFEVKNLNNLSAKYFLLLLLDQLIQQNFIDKKELLDMIDKVL